MLTPDLLSWTLGATVGIKYSKQFALNKQAQKVKITVVFEGTVPEDVTEEQMRERVKENVDNWFWTSEWDDDTEADTIAERKEIKIEFSNNV